MYKLAIFGGAFDPVHCEHTAICEAVQRELKPDRLLLLPSFNPPHKKAELMSSIEDRLNLLNLIFKKVEICNFEISSGQINYTSQTLRHFSAPNTEILYVIGGDSMADFLSWHKPEEICGLATLVVCHRANRQDDADKVITYIKQNFGAKVIELDYEGKDVSSTLIRYMVSLGRDISGFIAPKVHEYIKTHKLYREYADLAERVRAALFEQTFFHSCNVALTALKINAKLKLDNDKVFLAGLLHDIAKHDSASYCVPKDALNTPVEHQFAGAIKAREFGVDCPDVLEAITYHTTGKAGMTQLMKLIYVADMISPERDFDGVETLRREVEEDFERGFVACLVHSYDYLIKTKSNADIYPLTTEAYLYYTKGEKI